MFRLKLAARWLLPLLAAAMLAWGFSSGERKQGVFTLSQDDSQLYRPNQIVIKFKDRQSFGPRLAKTGDASFNNLLKVHGISQLEQVWKGKSKLQKGPSAIALESIYYANFTGNESPAKVAAAFRTHPAVQYAEPLYLHWLDVTPNDPSFIQQAHLSIVEAQGAWDVIKGEQGNAVVAVVDGGTDADHPDLAANLWINPGEIANNGLDDDGNGFVDDVNGWNFANNSNDPTGISSTPTNAEHGTNTAGIACAVTNNGAGVSGASWNARLMAINAAHGTEDNTVAFGFDGVVYAVENGADVVNCSWGRDQGGPSSFEQDIIQLGLAEGVAIVAAGGNNGTSAPHYPSSYSGVISVAATNDTDVKASFSNFGATIKLSAPGVSIITTSNGGGVTTPFSGTSGTSFSSPAVAGVVALVKTLHPDWSGIQAAEQVRVTADNIDAVNPSFAGLLGRGRLNARRAVTETVPSIRISEVTFTETNGNGAIEANETVQLSVKVRNFLSGASNVNLILTENDQFMTVSSASANIPALGMMEEAIAAFTFNVSNIAPSGRSLNFALQINSDGYQDSDRFSLVVESAFATVAINNVDVSLTNIGRIGYSDPNNSLGGVGFRFMNPNGPSLLFEGGIIAGSGTPGTGIPIGLSNAVRGLRAGDNPIYNADFAGVQGGELRVNTPGLLTAQESFAVFRDNLSDKPMNLRITQETFASNQAPNDDIILMRYTIENTGQNALQNFFFGFYFDWDIGTDQEVFENAVNYDAARKLGYVSFGTTVVGASVVSTTSNISYRAIDNSGVDFGVNDSGGFTDAEKWLAISGGVQVTSRGPADVSHVIGSGPFTIEPNAIVHVGFALLAGVGLQDLLANADAAQAFWNQLFVTAVEEPTPGIPTEFALQQNYPNPFNPATEIRYDLAEPVEVELAVYNLLGQKIRTLVSERKAAGFYNMSWDGKNDVGEVVASGVYVYELRAGGFVQSRKMTLVR